MVAVLLASRIPKSRPDTVTLGDPLSATFCCILEITAASKLIADIAVPTSEPTVTTDKLSVLSTTSVMHAAVVALDQLRVEHVA